MSKRKVVVVGASPRPERASYQAVVQLIAHGFEVFPVALRDGEIDGRPILTGMPRIENVDVMSVYVSPKNIAAWSAYMLELKPRKIIFNPGAENPEFRKRAELLGIECQDACTRVLVTLNEF